MNILIFEYITGGGMVGQSLPAALVKEGEVMLKAIACDFSDISDVQVSILRDYRLLSSDRDMVEYVVTEERNYRDIIESIEEEIDALIIIAPECNGVLENLCNEYSDRNFILLNSATESVELTSDKLKTHAYLSENNIAQIPTFEIHDIDCIESEKIIVKPVDGVGCENIYLATKKTNFDKLLSSAEEYNYIVQPYIQGKNASLSLLCWDGECRILSANAQTINVNDECLSLQGCVVNALERDEFLQFSMNLIKAIPGLKGYVGIDIIITEDEILLVEINPRLTTSYAGLKSACGLNVAELILKTFVNQRLPSFIIPQGTSVVIHTGAEYAA